MLFNILYIIYEGHFANNSVITIILHAVKNLEAVMTDAYFKAYRMTLVRLKEYCIFII